MELKQKKKILLEILLVATFFILLICGVIYIFNKIIESDPIKSSIAYISQEKTVAIENVKEIKMWIDDFSDKTKNHLDQFKTWLHLKSVANEDNENFDRTPIVTPVDSNPIEYENSSVIVQEDNSQAPNIAEPDLSTPEKIKEFQRSQGLPATGVIGNLTRNALKRLREDGANASLTQINAISPPINAGSN